MLDFESSQYRPSTLPGGQNLIHAWRANILQRLTFGAAMRKSGGTPSPTLTGVVIIPCSIIVEVTTAGTLTGGVLSGGVGAVKYSIDNGVNYTTGVPLAASIVLTGSGRTMINPDGTYTLGTTFKQVITDVTNACPGQGNIATSGVGGIAPTYDYKNSAICNRGNLYFPNDCGLKHSMTAEPGSGNDQPVSVIWVGAHAIAPTAGSTVNAAWAFQDSANSGNGVLEFTAQAVGGVSKWAINKRDDTASNTAINGGTADTNWHIFELVYTGTSVQLWVDGVAITLSTSTLNKGVTTLSTFTIAGASTSALFYEYRMAEVLIFNVAISDFCRLAHRQVLKRYYNL